MPHIVKNFGSLATTPLRIDALEIVEAGLSAIDTKEVIKREVAFSGSTLCVKGRCVDLAKYKRVFFVGIGKCAADAAAVFDAMLGGWITDGVVVDVRGVELRSIKSEIGTHPLPSEANVRAARSVERLLRRATQDDLVLTFISGGGSALLCLPNDIKCGTLARITRLLMRRGATIDELNIVRKHLSLIQGGQYAAIAYPAHVFSLIFSDVPGNDMSVIASGPTVLDKTTKEDAKRILEKYDIARECSEADCALVETPKDEKYFKRVENIIVLSNETALAAMARRAEKLGYAAEIAETAIEGEARELGVHIARQARAGGCVLYGGETTVTVRGSGIGGRNQELALGALAHITDGVAVVAVASDGWDNSPAAGAIADMPARKKSEELGLDPQAFLDNNDSHTFFKKVGAVIETGRLGSNVSDLYFSLGKKAA